jgi:hypothetical protein
MACDNDGVKRATRYKAEVFHTATGATVWEFLAHDNPPAGVAQALARGGFGYRRASTPSDEPAGPVFSMLDPDNSIAAGIEFADRRDTARGRVLRHLIANLGVWIPRHKIRSLGGDSGDRRVRELRQLNWPIEMRQLDDDDAWSVRLVIADRPLPPAPPDDGPWEQLSLTDPGRQGGAGS